MKATKRATRRNNRTKRNTRRAKRGGLFGMSSTESQLNTIRKLAYNNRNASAISRMRTLADYIEDTIPFNVDPMTLRTYQKNPKSYYKMLKSNPEYAGETLSFKEYVGATMR